MVGSGTTPEPPRWPGRRRNRNRHEPYRVNPISFSHVCARLPSPERESCSLFTTRAAWPVLCRDFSQFLSQERILGILRSQTCQKVLCLVRLFLPEVNHGQQDLGKGTKVMPRPRHQLQVLNARVLAAIHAIEMHEPADKKRQAAHQILIQP